MLSKAERDRLKAIISDTITLLCRNSIQKFKRDFNVEGLIGITVDSEDLLLVSIKESVKNPNAPLSSEGSGSEEDVSDDGSSVPGTPGRKRKRRRKKNTDGHSSPKVARSGNDYDNDWTGPSFSDNTGATPNRDFSGSQFDNTRVSYDGDTPSNDSSMYTLQEMKQDQADDDLIEIIKEEPGQYRERPEHIVSIQSLQQNPHMSSMNTGVPGMMPGMSPGGIPPIGVPPGSMMSPPQMGDLNEQVELMPGSGVFVKRSTFNQLQFIDKGSKLVRKLVREIFPDVHLLASSSCMGKGETSAGLDRHKVEVIKAYSKASCQDLTDAKITFEINIVCKEMRQQLRRRGLMPPRIRRNLKKTTNLETLDKTGITETSLETQIKQEY